VKKIKVTGIINEIITKTNNHNKNPKEIKKVPGFLLKFYGIASEIAELQLINRSLFFINMSPYLKQEKEKPFTNLIPGNFKITSLEYPKWLFILKASENIQRITS